MLCTFIRHLFSRPYLSSQSRFFFLLFWYLPDHPESSMCNSLRIYLTSPIFILIYVHDYCIYSMLPYLLHFPAVFPWYVPTYTLFYHYLFSVFPLILLSIPPCYLLILPLSIYVPTLLSVISYLIQLCKIYRYLPFPFVLHKSRHVCATPCSISDLLICFTYVTPCNISVI